MALFESYERRIDQINAVLNSYGISSIEEAEKITKDAGLDVYDQVKKIQPICFENACWAYTVGAAIAIKKGCRRAADAAAAIGEGLQAFCIPGSVADHRKVGLGHGNLGKMLLEEETDFFFFLAGHESFAAAEGAIGIAEKANKVRQKPLRVILNGLGKDAAQIISRINGFTFVETQYDYKAAKLNIVSEHAYSDGLRATVKCYGADDVQEGVAIMHHENVGVSITGNSTNPTRFQHPVAGTYKKECIEQDYVEKPFNPLELVARVKSQLRRYTQLGNAAESSASVYTVGGLSINDDLKEVTVDGEVVKLTPIEYNILLLLVKNQGKVFSINQIYESIWNEDAIGADNTVAVHIRHIREKIEINPKEPRYLKVVWGVGYKIDKN